MQIRWLPETLCLAAALAVTPAFAAAPPPAGAAPDPRAVLDQARAKQALAEYAEAAEGLERFARMSPKAAEAPDALKDAVVLRLGLRQEDQALKDVDLFLKDYGASLPAQAALVSFALGAHAAEHEDYAGVQKRLAGWVSAFDRSAALDLRVQAHALLGHAYVKQDQAKKAEAEYAVVRDLWRDPAAAERAVRAGGGDDRRLAKALTGVGEATFFFAEKKRRDVDAVHFPEYRGKGSKDEILEHMRTKVAAWVQKKRAVVEEAERAYQEILAIQPAPPPRWVIAAASRVGQMWGKFTAEFRAAPVPREWKGHGPVPGTTMTFDQLRGTYYQALDDASEPMKTRAKAAFKVCLDYAAKYQYSDDFSRRCSEWLDKHYSAEHHRVDEILPRYGLVGWGVGRYEPLPDPR